MKRVVVTRTEAIRRTVPGHAVLAAFVIYCCVMAYFGWDLLSRLETLESRMKGLELVPFATLGTYRIIEFVARWGLGLFVFAGLFWACGSERIVTEERREIPDVVRQPQPPPLASVRLTDRQG